VGIPSELVDEVELIDALLKPLANRPVDLSDPDWFSALGQGPHPLDEAGVRAEAEAALGRLLVLYPCDEPTRIEVRDLLNRCRSFSWATNAPDDRTPEAFRQQLMLLSARDHAEDTRDEMVSLNDLCQEARDAGVDIRPLLLEIADLSSDEDKYGLGSLRGILLMAARRDPVGLW